MQLAKKDKVYYHWPPPTQTSHQSQTSASSHQENGSMLKYKNDYALHEEYLHELDSQLVGVVGVDRPLMLRLVEQLESMYPESKVTNYLVASLEKYEPPPVDQCCPSSIHYLFEPIIYTSPRSQTNNPTHVRRAYYYSRAHPWTPSAAEFRERIIINKPANAS
ncbi:hypothetical protein B0J17DRAFT_629396 [Rhizoctonia solani]|nr:hypothetical protein B0J17DRAFT_629396 [Rhizoctonia solani]